MNSITKTRVLLSIITLLVLVNIGMLAYFLSDKPKKNNDRNRFGLTDFLKKDIGFDENQINQFEALKKSQFEKMRPLFEDMRKTKDTFYLQLKNENITDSALNAAAASIGDKQKNIDLELFHQLKSIRNLCTPEQQPKFDSLFPNMVRKMFVIRRGPPNRDSAKPSK